MTTTLHDRSGPQDLAHFPSPFIEVHAVSRSGMLAGKRILTVDDQPESTRLIRLALGSALGIEVCEVNDPSLALLAAASFHPDLVLLDIEMPVISGGIVWRQFRSAPEFKELPIIFLTSRISEDEVSPNAADALTQLMAKPVSLSRLTERLLTLLSPSENRAHYRVH